MVGRSFRNANQSAIVGQRIALSPDWPFILAYVVENPDPGRLSLRAARCYHRRAWPDRLASQYMNEVEHGW